MKRIILYAVLLLISVNAYTQKDSIRNSRLNSLWNKANKVVSGKTSTGNSLSTDEIVSGLKEALSQGAKKSSDRLSVTDGFFRDAVIKILMPSEVTKVENKLRILGMGKLVDNAILSMNRAAEDASKSAAPIFLNAIKKMTVQDALGILKGTDTSATSYLRRSTSSELTNAFMPVVEASLKKVDATRYWKDAFTAYNKFTATPVNTDINSYVTQRALNGIFYYVAQEEKNIRANPSARVNDILKKVFGTK